MGDKNMAGGLVQTWVAVTDTDGRTHLEAQWVHAGSTPTHATHAA